VNGMSFDFRLPLRWVYASHSSNHNALYGVLVLTTSHRRPLHLYLYFPAPATIYSVFCIRSLPLPCAISTTITHSHLS
jgi:hypothetical protein